MGAGAPSQCRTPTCARGGGTKRPDQPLRFTQDCANHGNTCTAMPRHRPLASRRQKLDRPWDGRQHSVSPLLPQHLEHSMPKTLWLALMLSASLVGLVLAQSHHGDTSSGPPESGFAAQMMRAMQRMDAGMMAAKSTGNPDRDFAAMMIPHHQGAIDMAKVELIYGFAASCSRYHCRTTAGDRGDATLPARSIRGTMMIATELNAIWGQRS